MNLFTQHAAPPAAPPPWWGWIVGAVCLIGSLALLVLLLSLLVGAAPAAEPPGKPAGPTYQWYRHAPVKEVREGQYLPFLLDLERHLDPKHGRYYSHRNPVTHAHETTHGINSDLRNRDPQRRAGFYVGGGWAMLLPHPKFRLSDAGRAVPGALRGGRFNLYFVQSLRDWETDPLYVFDEWTAYTNGAAHGLELLHAGRTREHTDNFHACLEFSIYAVAVGRAVVELDPGYALKHPEFGDFLRHELTRSLSYWRVGQEVAGGKYRWDDRGLAARFVSGREGAPLRDALERLIGFEDAEKILDICR